MAHSSTAVAGILYVVASDQTLSRLEDLLTRLTVQNFKFLHSMGMNPTAAEKSMSLETKLDFSINKVIKLQRSTKKKEISITLNAG